LRLTAFVVAAAVAAAVHGRLAMSPRMARIHVALNTAVLVVLGAEWEIIVAALVAATVAGEVLASRASRESIIPAGLLAGASAAVLLLFWLLVERGIASWDLTAAAVAGAAAGGLLGAPMALAVGPLAEWSFDHTTRITMAEWLNFEHPLLRELASVAPGTFQHSVSVSVLCDAGARAIGADAFVARLGALYHDVGKLKAPEYFGENQHGVNPHAALPPWQSAAILRAHVDDGVSLLRYYGMVRPLARFVREHHGTSLMPGLAVHPAAAEARGEAYRYLGPSPQTRETAILMLADQLEAMARVAPPVDGTACAALVRGTLTRVRESGELVDAGLSAGDLERLEPAFGSALQAMYHRRVGYGRAPASAPAAS
jgi:putative nucleotidyltransferase with HDIG domain